MAANQVEPDCCIPRALVHRGMVHQQGGMGHNGQTMAQMAPRPAGTPALSRLNNIAQARQLVLQERQPQEQPFVLPWIERSWRRCLAMGHEPQRPVAFDTLSAAQARRTRDANHVLTEAARPVLQELGRALADTRYFAILTNNQGAVVDVNGPIDRGDRRADLITRVGVDLSEQCVGTTAICAALSELQPVWLHRGEHFFHDTSSYSCAGAPLFGPDGACVGMLDLTGVDAPERPELKHLVVQSARSIENILALRQPHVLLLRLNWPGHRLGDDSDGLVGLDGDGLVATSNSAARQMLPALAGPAMVADNRIHCDDLFALPASVLFDAAQHAPASIDVPLWSGLRLQALAAAASGSRDATRAWHAMERQPVPASDRRRLKDIETALIRKAVQDARGNVTQAAYQLGVSRATVYRKLGLKPA